jgi:hypothetical protein
MEADRLIISKQYFELTTSELEQVSALVSNETEFDEMKAFLLSTQASFESQKIMSTPELDDKIFAQLNASVSTNRPWYNSFLLFLFPSDRRVYQYPAFQLVLATVLVFGAVNLINFDHINDNTLAFEDVTKVKEKNTDELEEKVIELAKKEVDLEESEISLDLNIESHIKIVLIEEFENDNNEVDFSEKDINQKGYNYNVEQESETLFLEDSEIIEVIVESDSRQNVNPKVEGSLDRDVLINTNSEPVYKEIDLDNEKINEVSVGVSIGNTVSTESRKDKAIKLEKNNVILKKEETVDNALDDYSNGSVVETLNGQIELEEKLMVRKASVNLTPELNELFYEVK